jgi:hypothetical protein
LKQGTTTQKIKQAYLQVGARQIKLGRQWHEEEKAKKTKKRRRRR